MRAGARLIGMTADNLQSQSRAARINSSFKTINLVWWRAGDSTVAPPDSASDPIMVPQMIMCPNEIEEVHSTKISRITVVRRYEMDIPP